MNWRFVEVLQSEDCISEYEEKIGYRFPEDFRECIKRNNGGYPEKKMFYSRKGSRKHKRVFNSLLSFNKEDLSSIWQYNDWRGRFSDWFRYSDGKIENYVTFANDPFGNMICFDKRSDKIVFIDHEKLGSDAEEVADSFTYLINSLKSR